MTSMSSFKDCTSDQSCKLDFKAVYTYDAKGGLTQAMNYKADGSLDERRVYTYNANDLKREEIVNNAAGSIRQKETYEYEYDSTGNWIKKTTTTAVRKEGALILEPPHVIKRTITYFREH